MNNAKTVLTSPDSPVWAGLRKAQRERLAGAVSHLQAHGRIQRSDIMRIGEVNIATASTDIAAILKRAPGLMSYDATARCYVKGSE